MPRCPAMLATVVCGIGYAEASAVASYHPRRRHFHLCATPRLIYKMSMRHTTAPIILALLLAAGGGARYEYDVARPPDMATHVGTKADAVLPIEPLEYRLRTAESRLVMLIYN